jgi:hypothetical protein
MDFSTKAPLRGIAVIQIFGHFMSYISDDSLWIIRIMAIDILKLKFTKILLSVTLIFQFVLTAIEFYFFVCIFSFTDIVKYSPLFFGMIYVILYHHYLQNRKCFLFQAMLNIAAVLLCGEIALSALTDFKLWALDSAGYEILTEITTESMLYSYFIIGNTILSLIPLILFVVPVPNDEDVFFPLYIFDRWFPDYTVVLNLIYRSTFVILAYAMINGLNILVYTIEHIKFQVYLLVKHIDHITTVVEYTNCDDGFLLRNQHYQTEVEHRIKFCIKRHIEIIK